MIFIFIIFFKCYRNHRDLHSFPTRRSSDLSVELRRRRNSDGDDADCETDLPSAILHIEIPHIEGVVLDELPARFIEDKDRKSTRLNSSHVAISYAVFCLKKKKTIKLTNYRI